MKDVLEQVGALLMWITKGIRFNLSFNSAIAALA